ncbi:hypothetical protein ABAC460_22340 [Asticcacaulis sp. AC460]|uniref:type II toxin-antitoxin system ParD family antitoxin n=1 Tax=Asticcacaulis sp. AC460 TaxID=1282360 RepID=UPI0003C3C240|nr:type II toxin-antitoxin system ParD family antitoxin [Asticcacaulis sp. AC460]ESQ86793.1 hypothetical protein ABAC460_22340 [Asticcacaulis sp. AC460]
MPSSYALGTHFETMMERLIQSGRYNSKSEILRDGLRIIEERESRREVELEELRAALRAGMESGPGIPAEDVFAELKSRYRKMAEDKGL